MFLNRFIQKLLVVSAVVARRTMANPSNGTASQTEAGAHKYLTSKQAIALDQELFTEYRYSVDQLMELAGLSVAIAVAKHYPVHQYGCVLVVVGPGNNGGDGLVAARHLALFGYRPTLLYPRRPENALYEALLHQCQAFNINVIEDVLTIDIMDRDYDVIVDALFGFSFKPPVRPYLWPALDLLINTSLPVCSVDVPSGWDVDGGPGPASHVSPALLVSLSAPKLCARRVYLDAHKTKHVLGGRFLPPALIAKYHLHLPPYPGHELLVDMD